MAISPIKAQEVKSENGWYLSPHGTIRLLIIYAEIEYDLHPERDTRITQGWEAGKMPEFAGNLCDAFPTKTPQGELTRYFHQMSMGDFLVLGDHLNFLVTIKESEVRGINNIFSNTIRSSVAKVINEHPQGFRTANNLNPSDFDLWTSSKGYGLTKINKADSAFDHVMLILRNHHLMEGGYTNNGNFSKIFGYPSGTFSVQHGRSFNIIRHEFSHQLLGGNNFHAGGGQHHQGGANYFISFQGGYSLMGDANSSFIGCNGWDRQRLGWKHTSKSLQISALNDQNLEISSDLDGGPKDLLSSFWLRDFITYGDVIRIKLPHIPDSSFQQWLWVENHQTKARNFCEFDDYMFSELDCKPNAVPGVYMFQQIDKDIRSGPETFSGKHFGDYIKPIPASGFFDLVFSDSTVLNDCVSYGPIHAFEQKPNMANPLSGASDLERVRNDFGDGKGGPPDGVMEHTERRLLFVEKRGNEYIKSLVSMGMPKHTFTLEGVNTINLSTNPSTASSLTHVSLSKSLNHPKDNKQVYLNGLQIKIIDKRKNELNPLLEDLKIEITYNNNLIDKNLRWRADGIVVPPKTSGMENSLVLKKRKTLILERSLTPSRINQPDTVEGQFVFSQPTHLILPENAVLKLEKRAKLLLKEGSVLHLKSGSHLILEKRASVKVGKNARYIVDNGAMITQKKKSAIVFK